MFTDVSNVTQCLSAHVVFMWVGMCIVSCHSTLINKIRIHSQSFLFFTNLKSKCKVLNKNYTNIWREKTRNVCICNIYDLKI